MKRAIQYVLFAFQSMYIAMKIVNIAKNILNLNNSMKGRRKIKMDKYGYAVITIIEYRALIEDINNKKECISKLNEVNQKENKRYKVFENLFLEDLMENNEYHLENMKNTNITDYHYGQLCSEFLKVGIDDLEYIDLKIKELKHRFDSQTSEKGGK